MFSPDEINTFEQQGQISPETAAFMRAKAGYPSPDPAANPPQTDYANPPQEELNRAPQPKLEQMNPSVAAGHRIDKAVGDVLGRATEKHVVGMSADEEARLSPQEKQARIAEQDGERPAAQVPNSPASPEELARPKASPATVAAPTRGSGGGSGSTYQSPLSKYEAAVKANQADQTRNLENQRDFDITQANLVADQTRRSNESIQAYDERIQGEHVKRTQRAEAELEDLRARSKALAEYREDPNQLWGSMDAGKKILATIFMIVGGGIAGRTGQRNGAADALNAAIDRNIQAQRQNYNAKKESIQAQNSAFGRMMDLYHDEDSASLALRTLQTDQAARKLAEMTAGAKSQQVRLTADQALTELQGKSAESEYSFARLRAQQAAAAGSHGIPDALKKLGIQSNQQLHDSFVRWRADHPNGSQEEYMTEMIQRSSGKTPSGGDEVKVSPRLQGMLVKDETIEGTAEKRASQYGLVRGKPTAENPKGDWEVPSTASGLWNWGSSGASELAHLPSSAGRKATRETLVDERASAAAQGKPDAETMATYRAQESTNNPWSIAQMLNEAERNARVQGKAIKDVAKHSKVTTSRDDEDDK